MKGELSLNNKNINGPEGVSYYMIKQIMLESESEWIYSNKMIKLS